MANGSLRWKVTVGASEWPCGIQSAASNVNARRHGAHKKIPNAPTHYLTIAGDRLRVQGKLLSPLSTLAERTLEGR